MPVLSESNYKRSHRGQILQARKNPKIESPSQAAIMGFVCATHTHHLCCIVPTRSGQPTELNLCLPFCSVKEQRQIDTTAVDLDFKWKVSAHFFLHEYICKHNIAAFLRKAVKLPVNNATLALAWR